MKSQFARGTCYNRSLFGFPGFLALIRTAAGFSLGNIDK
jgi:hypothetical protein